MMDPYDPLVDAGTLGYDPTAPGSPPASLPVLPAQQPTLKPTPPSAASDRPPRPPQRAAASPVPRYEDPRRAGEDRVYQDAVPQPSSGPLGVGTRKPVRRPGGPAVAVGVALVLTGVVGIGGAASSVVDTVTEVTDGPIVGTNETVPRYMEPGEKLTLWVEQGQRTAMCGVSDPRGALVVLSRPTVTREVNGQAYSVLGEFEARTGGTYLIGCRNGEVRLVGGSASDGLFPAVGGIFGGVLAMIAGGAALVFGGLTARRRPIG